MWKNYKRQSYIPRFCFYAIQKSDVEYEELGIKKGDKVNPYKQGDPSITAVRHVANDGKELAKKSCFISLTKNPEIALYWSEWVQRHEEMIERGHFDEEDMDILAPEYEDEEQTKIKPYVPRTHEIAVIDMKRLREMSVLPVIPVCRGAVHLDGSFGESDDEIRRAKAIAFRDELVLAQREIPPECIVKVFKTDPYKEDIFSPPFGQTWTMTFEVFKQRAKFAIEDFRYDIMEQKVKIHSDRTPQPTVMDATKPGNDKH